MRSHVFLVILLTGSMICATTLILHRVFAETSPIITIMADGSIDPLTAPIQRTNPDVYVLTKDITSIADGIVIDRDNVTLDGQGHTIEGTGTAFTVGVFLSNRNGITLRNLRVTGYHYGMELDSSSNIEISGNVIEANRGDGIFLDEVSYVNLTWNSVVSNLADGIFLYWYSNSNDLSRNIIKDNNYRGIDLFSGCQNNTVIENDIISNNMTGIYLSASSNNTIYHNNFIGNTVQAETYRSQNIWDNAYPYGGNYWNDYSGTDLKTGPNQDNPGPDGIGDAPRLIDTNNSDNYPLMARWGNIEGDINNDLTVDIYGAILLSNAFGSTPVGPNWNPKADFNKNDVIDIFDAIVLAINYGRRL